MDFYADDHARYDFPYDKAAYEAYDAYDGYDGYDRYDRYDRYEDAYNYDTRPQDIHNDGFYDDSLPEINIEDEYYDEANEETEEVWLPYTPPPPPQPSGQSGPQQQVVFASPGLSPGLSAYPGNGQLAESYCVLHPGQCRDRGLTQLNASDLANTTEQAGGTNGGKGLGRVDLSGLGMVLLIGLLLLVGVHFGWDSEKKPGPGEYTDRTSLIGKIRGNQPKESEERSLSLA